MAKMNGHLLLTMSQVKSIARGKTVEVRREGKPLFVGLKSKHSERVKLLSQIKTLKEKLAKVEKQDKTGVSHGK